MRASLLEPGEYRKGKVMFSSWVHPAEAKWLWGIPENPELAQDRRGPGPWSITLRV